MIKTTLNLKKNINRATYVKLFTYIYRPKNRIFLPNTKLINLSRWPRQKTSFSQVPEKYSNNAINL